MADTASGETRRNVAGARVEWILAALLVVVLGVFVWATFGKSSAFAASSSGRGPFFFPRLVLGVMLLAAPVLFLAPRRTPVALPAPAPLLRMGWLILATGIYCALIDLIGFLVASALFAAFVPILLGRRDLLTVGVIAVAYAAAVWALFEKVFLIILPGLPEFY